MILDTSAVVAVVMQEPGYEAMVEKLTAADALNFGDCMAYAVAKVAQEPLLCTGENFARTDIEPG